MLLELTSAQIKSGIENMKPIVGRNNIVTVGDITLIDDCYNANPVSMKSSLDLLMLAKGKKIAILGDMFELGKNEKNMHREVGEYAAKLGVDRIYCVGNLGEYISEGARECSRSGSDKSAEYIGYWKTRDDAIRGIKDDLLRGAGERKLIPPGSTVLVKASHGMHFEEIVKVFKEIF